MAQCDISNRGRRGLFVSFEGLAPTVADSQVIIHLVEMRKKNIDIDLWAFAVQKNIYDYSLQHLSELNNIYNVSIKLFRAVRPAVPMSELLNAILLLWLMVKYKLDVDFVHARTDYAASVCGIARIVKKFILIWDCRGDAKAEFLLKYSQTTLLRRVAARFQSIILRMRVDLSAKLCDKAIFVSDKLKEKSTSSCFMKPFEIVPCVASSDLFYFSPVVRNEFRGKLGIKPSDKVIIYSGSMAGYQIFEKCVELFNRLADQDTSLTLLILTPYRQDAIKYLKDLSIHKYRLLQAPLAEVNGYLNAADLGLFLRERNDVNVVASPVKFAEYCLAGLPIIMTDAVEQSYNISQKLSNGIYYDFQSLPEGIEPFTNERRSLVAQKAAALLARKIITEKYVKMYLDC